MGAQSAEFAAAEVALGLLEVDVADFERGAAAALSSRPFGSSSAVCSWTVLHFGQRIENHSVRSGSSQKSTKGSAGSDVMSGI